ncbi:hypothetical protein J8V57_14680 [Xenorhabdus sp. PB61.4]|uniref:colicin-like bacteriocin tRNase domain-containing protein n=1 Tax=Xenorhabdus sp. PB61.4 TaxID=2788940 RepID=UPI001E2DD1CC|nr:colicin-like bacteriocin tRNase domain-containing protein [Xenorhabdus sp. PB61.4]MCC8367500.1 hypothetical protein [Xenorhabdus sp. PB61.4]
MSENYIGSKAGMVYEDKIIVRPDPDPRLDPNDNLYDDRDGKDYPGNGGGSANSDQKYAIATLSMIRLGYPAMAFPINNTLNVTINTGFFDPALMHIENYIDKAKPYAARLATNITSGLSKAGSLFRVSPVGIGMSALWPSSTASEEFERKSIEEARAAAKIRGSSEIYHISALPVEQVTSVPREQISQQSTVITKVLSEPVINLETQQRHMAITKNRTKVRVVKAEKTNQSNVYSAQVVARMKPMQISVDNTVSSPQKNQVKANTTPEVKVFSSAVIVDTHHVILDFDGKHEPIYISVSKIPTVAEEKAQLEEAKK